MRRADSPRWKRIPAYYGPRAGRVFAGPAAATYQTDFPAHLPRDNEMRSYQKALAPCRESY